MRRKIVTGPAMQTAPLAHILAIVRKPFNERTQEEVHALVVLLTEQLRTFSFLTVARKKLPFRRPPVVRPLEVLGRRAKVDAARVVLDLVRQREGGVGD